MARPLFDSEYIFGIHEPGGEHHMKEAGKPGWILFTEAVGHDANNRSGKDFRQWSDQGYGVICRINNGYEPEGTIPNSSQYSAFAQRCANFVAASQGCKIWIIGNEMNYSVEWPPLGAAHSVAPAATAAPSSADTVESTQQSGNQHSNSTPRDRTLPDSGSGIGRMWRSLLRWLSGGMGSANLYDEERLEVDAQADTDTAFERAAAVALSDEELATSDPFNRDPKQRFNAIFAPEELPENSQDDASSTTDGPGGIPAPASAPATRSASGRQPITPQLYAQCYRLCRDAIHRKPGHSNDQVLVGAPAPWNVNTSYAGNPSGDWIVYFRDILNQIGAGNCDGMTIHTYTHGVDPNLINSTQKMNPPFQNYHYHFYTYKDFMNAVPSNMRHLPMYLTETDQNDPWENRNSGWVQRAFGDIDHWNKQSGNQQIRAMILYRWPKIDKWYIEGKQGVIDDFRTALRSDYRWNARQVGTGGPPTTPVMRPPVVRPPVVRPPVQPSVRPPVTSEPLVAPAISLRSNGKVRTFKDVNMRRTAGYRNQPASDVIRQIPSNTELTVLSSRSSAVDGLAWWFVRATVPVPSGGFTSVDGWVAQNEPDGDVLIRKVTGSTTPPVTTPSGSQPPVTRPPVTAPTVVPSPTKFTKGDSAHTVDIVRMRRTAGFRNKAANDVITDLASNSSVEIVGGPTVKDRLTWWQIETTVDGRSRNGWVAAALSATVPLLAEGDPPTVDETFSKGAKVETADIVRMRKTPGWRTKPISDIVTDIVEGVTGTVLAGPRQVDNLVWWEVEMKDAVGRTVKGWMAEATAAGLPLLVASTLESDGSTSGVTSGGVTPGGVTPSRPRPTDPDPAPPVVPTEPDVPGQPVVSPPSGSSVALFQKEDVAVTKNIVRMRKTAGFIGKPTSDVVADVPIDSRVKIIGGPTTKDRLTWWQVETKDANGKVIEGWMAESASTGALLEKVDGDTSPSVPAVAGKFKEGNGIVTTDFVRMRKKPGYFDKPSTDIVAELWQGTVGVVIDGPVEEDELIWWQVRARDGDGRLVTGWMAESGPTGIPLLAEDDGPTIDPGKVEPGGGSNLAVGDLLVTKSEVRVRSTPGHLNKPNSDVLGFYRERVTLNFISGPTDKNGLTWLQSGGISPSGAIVGWVAQSVNNTPLISDAALLPGTGIPNRAKGLYLGAPTRTPFGIAQLWGENPDFYKQFKPKNVPLLGHNGVDFLTPTGTDLVATDGGQVIHVGRESSGFGNWVLLQHAWGRSIYAHLSSISVSVGQGVGRGGFLGKSGNSGSSTGPHLHFAIARNSFNAGDGWGGFIDPLPYLPPKFVRLPAWVLGPQPQRSTAPEGAASATAPLSQRMDPSGVTVDIPE